MSLATHAPVSKCRPLSGSVVHARDNHVELEIEQTRDREVHAVGGRAHHEAHAGLGLEDPQRHIEREGVARAAAVAIRRDDGHLAQRRQLALQAADSFGAKAIVIAEQDLHECGRCEKRVNILKASWRR